MKSRCYHNIVVQRTEDMIAVFDWRGNKMLLVEMAETGLSSED